MEEKVLTYEEYLAMEKESEKYWEQKRKECGITKPLNTYEDCWDDVRKWRAYDPDHSFHSPWIFEMFREDFTKYPIEYQMRLLIDMYVYEISMNLRSFNAVLRKIYKAESKEFKATRTQGIRNELHELALIETDDKGKEFVTVYRGINHESAPSDIAISWTYNIEKAKMFANRWAVLHKDDRCCRVLQGKVYIKDILSVAHNRSEDEIIAFPHKVFDISEVEDFIAAYDYKG